jgi:type VI secretion system secreted protein Hcp
MFIALMSLALPLLAQEQQSVVTIQFSGEKAEAITSFSWGVSPSSLTTGDGASAVRPAPNALSFTKPVTQLSNILYLGCIGGKHFSSVVLKVKKKGKDQQEFLVIKMEEVVVSSYQTSGRDGDSTTDTTTLNYANVEYTLINP